jgi:putative transposase
MRHLNGVYTQRYNSRNKCDGPLFRGRYKSILIDTDSYLLQAVRYIHREKEKGSSPFLTYFDSDDTWHIHGAPITNRIS